MQKLKQKAFAWFCFECNFCIFKSILIKNNPYRLQLFCR